MDSSKAFAIAALDLSARVRIPLMEHALADSAAPCLDIGSGAGYVAATLLARRGTPTVCVDLDGGNLCALAAALAATPAAPKLLLVRADATRLPFRDGAFATVLASEVLEHIEDDTAAAHEIARVLRAGGVACITVPTTSHRHESLLTACGLKTVHDFEGPEHHVRPGYDPAALAALLARTGLEVRETREFLRHASRLVVDLVAVAHLLVERLGHGRRGWTWSEAVAAARTSKAFALYRIAFPLLLLFTRLDALFARARGWQVLMVAVRPAVDRGAPRRR